MNRSHRCGLGMFALLGWVAACQAGYIDHNFDGPPFTNGATFVTPVLQWQASTAGVAVVNTKAASGSQSVFVPGGAALSNVVAVTNPVVVWTDIRVAPCLGEESDLSVTSGVTTVQYFGTNGYLNVWTGSGWQACSNDVWGQPVAQVTNGVFVDLSIYQNFTSQKAALLLNDQVVIQDLPFLTPSPNYNAFKMGGAYGDAWLDDAYIQATYDPARLTHDRNGDGISDGNELQTYGYVARTLYVGAGPGCPRYDTIQAALNAWRARDSLYVYAGQYAEDVTVASNVTVGGQAFTNSGSLTIGAGLTVAFQNATAWSNVTIGANAQVAFNQVLTCSNLSVSAGATATFSGGRLLVPPSGVDMTGTFSITHTWGTQATVGLDFVDDFELYAADTQVANLGFRGWGASGTDLLVKAAQGVAGSKAVVVPDAAVLSNRLTSVGQPKIWTDFTVRPVLGEAPTGVITNNYTSLCFVDTNGFLNVWNAGTWAVCSRFVDGSAVPAMTTDSYTRVTLFLNFGNHLSALFVDSKLVYEKVPFPAGAAIPSYTSFRAESTRGDTYLDNIRISTNYPADLLSVDLDNDGIPDVLEIQNYDSLRVWPQGNVFKFK